MALRATRTVLGLLKWTAQLYFEVGKKVEQF